MNNKTYKYKNNGAKKSFHLKDADLFVFTVLYYKRYLTTRQITQLYNAFEGRDFSEASVFTKLNRYSQYGAILTKKIDKRDDSITKRATFSLKERMIDFLQELGKIPAGSSKRRYSHSSSLHTFCSREILGFWCKKSIKLGHTDTITLKRCVIGMEKNNLFKWKHYQPDIILVFVI